MELTTKTIYQKTAGHAKAVDTKNYNNIEQIIFQTANMTTFINRLWSLSQQ